MASFNRVSDAINMGEYDKAIENVEQYYKLIGHPLKGLSSLGHAYAAAGQREKALECLEKIKLREQSEPDKYFIWILLFSMRAKRS